MAVKDKPAEAPEKETPAEEVPTPTEADLVPHHPEDVYRVLSVADERQISQELQGRAVKAMVYSFPQDGKTVTGLSWIGVREAIRQVNTRGFGRIHIAADPPPVFKDVMVTVDTGKKDDKGKPITEEIPGIQATVYARDEMHGGGNWGTATQTKLFKLNPKRQGGQDEDGNAIWKPDPFAATKALSKAQRNAQEPFIPLELVESLKALYIGEGKVEYIPGVGHEITNDDRPAALTDDKAKAQVTEIRSLYDQIKQAHGAKLLPPARFNQYLNAAQHDHDRLADLLDHLKQILDTGSTTKVKDDGTDDSTAD